MNGQERQTHSQNDAPETSPAPQPGWPKIVKFEELARCGDEVWIDFHGQVYRLRRTRQGKLILTK